MMKSTSLTKVVTVVDNSGNQRTSIASQLWVFKELIMQLTMRDLKVRYKQAVLGVAWAAIQPLMMMAIFTVVFDKLAKIPSDGPSYPVFVFSGLLIWNLFASTFSSSSNSLVGSSALITKIYFPRIIVPISTVGVGFVDFLVSLALLILVVLFFNVDFHPVFLLIVPVIGIGTSLFALGIGLIFTSLIVKYRDFRFIITFIVQIWMYLTPVVYALSLIPEQYRWLAYLNPLTGYIEAARSSVLNNPIDYSLLSSSLLYTCVALFLGVRYFSKTESKFADII